MRIKRIIKKIFEVKQPPPEPPRKRGHWLDLNLHTERYQPKEYTGPIYDQDVAIYPGDYKYEDGF